MAIRLVLRSFLLHPHTNLPEENVPREMDMTLVTSSGVSKMRAMVLRMAVGINMVASTGWLPLVLEITLLLRMVPLGLSSTGIGRSRPLKELPHVRATPPSPRAMGCIK
jgi:hypothetical protein